MRYSILLILLLAGCRADFSDIVTGAGASGAAAVASLMTSSPAIVAGVTAGGALAGSIAVDDAPITAADYGGEDGQINSFYELMMLMTFYHLLLLYFLVLICNDH